MIPDNSATFVKLDIFQITDNSFVNEFLLPAHLIAEDGNRRDWITVVLVDLSLTSFETELILTGRFLDNDDVKVIINDTIKQNHLNVFRKFWYFIATKFKSTHQKAKFEVNFSQGVHYLEFWADRMPTLEKITFSNLSFKIPKTIQEKIEYKAKLLGFDTIMMMRLVKRESQFDPNAESPVGAKGLFQLTEITIKQINNLGYEISDPFDIDQNIEGGFIYFTWLYKRYEGQKDHVKKTLAAWNWGLNNVPVKGDLDFKGLPKETQNFINDILGTHDF